MKKIKVLKLTDIDIVLNVTRALFDKKGECEVVVKNIKESLSDKQRGLYWVWIKYVYEYTGDTPLEFHERYKETVFFNTYLADSENHVDLVEAVAAMKESRKAMDPKNYATIRRCIMKECSHLNATVDNMRVVLKQLESDAISLGVKLPAPPSMDYLVEPNKKQS